MKPGRATCSRLPFRLARWRPCSARRPATGTRAWHRHRPRSLPLLGVRRIRLAQATLPIRISRTADQFRQVPLLRCSTSLSVADVGGSLETVREVRQIPLDGPGKAWTVAIDRDGPSGTTLPSSTWTPSTSVSWRISPRMTGARPPGFPRKATGAVHHPSMLARVAEGAAPTGVRRRR